ncbi:MAG TPA: ferredoxin--NADP reductase [Acidimicrobiales bacterium]|jgi:ferredoxin-NADP reductase|nr:ferredoxin--NADP reductase [Acidimicrobiales bacterium]
MALSPGAGLNHEVARDHGFHAIRVREVVPETRDSSSFVLDVPDDLRDRYGYEPGQFLTFRCWVDGKPHLRCYSMSSSPAIDPCMQVTVKRVPNGIVSNWMIDRVGPGDRIEATLPAGVFGRRARDGDIIAFAGGSGITPILSILKTFLESSPGRARLFYANRHEQSVMFESELASLTERHGLSVVHHLDADVGLVDAAEIRDFAADCNHADLYLCGPGPFMALAEQTLLQVGASHEAIHIERFSPVEETLLPQPPPDDAGPTQVTIDLDGDVEVADHRPGTTVLQTARQLGLSPPFSCEAGNCATCMAKLAVGAVTMYTNNALTDDEVADGWILTCQAVPTTPSVHVIYGWEEN